MNSLRTDLIILAVIVSLGIHVGVMFAARGQVMTQIVRSCRSPERRGPMKVSRAAERPEPVQMAKVSDVRPEKAAPTAEAAAMPSAASEPAPADRALPSLPELEIPKPAEDAVARPDLIVGANPEPAPAAAVAKMAMNDAKASSDSSLPGLPASSAVAVGGLSAALSAPSVSVAPPVEAAPAVILRREDAAAGANAFKPEQEMRETVDKTLVEAEKAAVRELIDADEAHDLAKAVDLRVTAATLGSETYFRLKVSPRANLGVVAKDLVVLLDASGSVGTDRMASIRKAAKKILRSAANTGDRFNLVAFRDKYSYAFGTWRECDTESFEAADRWLNRKTAPFGRTDVFASVASVLALPRDPKRPLVALVVTDGIANTGVSDTDEILSRFAALNDGLVSVYMYGIKSSANEELIDSLTHSNRGESFIFDGWRWNAGDGIEKLSERFRDPVLSDLRLVFASGVEAETYPRLMKNLHRGESTEILGRVSGNVRELAFSLKGLNGKTAYEGFFRLPLKPSADPKLVEDWLRERQLDSRAASSGKDARRR